MGIGEVIDSAKGELGWQVFQALWAINEKRIIEPYANRMAQVAKVAGYDIDEVLKLRQMCASAARELGRAMLERGVELEEDRAGWERVIKKINEKA